MNDYYSLLGVRREASPSEITLAFRRLFKEKYQEEGDHFLYSDILQAYRTLSNCAKRRDYDLQLKKVVGKYEVSDPQNPSPADKKYLSGLNALDQKNFPSAVEYFTQAVKLAPENCHYYSQLGVALGMFPGRLSEAERYCKKAIELDPENPDVCYNLGFLYQRHNLVEAAQQAFMQAQRAEQKMWEKFFSRQAPPIEMPWAPIQDESPKTVGQPEAAPASGTPVSIPDTDSQEVIQTQQEESGDSAEPGTLELSLGETAPLALEGSTPVSAEPIMDELPEEGASELHPEASGISVQQPSEYDSSGSPSPVQGDVNEDLIDDGGQVILSEVIAGDEEIDTAQPKSASAAQELNIISNAAKGDFKSMPSSDEGDNILEELDSLEAVLNGSGPTAGIGSGDGELLLEMKQHHDIVSLPPPVSEARALPVSAGDKEETSLEDLEDEALSLLRELGMEPTEGVAETTETQESHPEASVSDQEAGAEDKPEVTPDAGEDGQEEADPEELARLEEMERNMAEELERLRQEREKMKKRKKK